MKPLFVFMAYGARRMLVMDTTPSRLVDAIGAGWKQLSSIANTGLTRVLIHRERGPDSGPDSVCGRADEGAHVRFQWLDVGVRQVGHTGGSRRCAMCNRKCSWIGDCKHTIHISCQSGSQDVRLSGNRTVTWLQPSFSSTT